MAFSRYIPLGMICLYSCYSCVLTRAAEGLPSVDIIKNGVTRALPLLEIASAVSADQRKCFTCHGQALPIMVSVEAQRRGWHVNQANLNRQVDHTLAHLARGQEDYRNGKGQGGAVDTAGYALWALDDAGHVRDEVTDAVIEYLLQIQQPTGYWRRSSHRPPSEASHFTTTYMALRALDKYAGTSMQSRVQTAVASARQWLLNTKPEDTEDRVFQLLALPYVEAQEAFIASFVKELRDQQQPDGGWSQLSTMTSDAYATATTLYALRHVGGLGNDEEVCQHAIAFLVDQQRPDGSWYVKTRAVPFQKHFETGFPHGNDQFISTTASAWATIALLESLPDAKPTPIETLPGTVPLDWPEADLSTRLMVTAHSYVEGQIALANARRKPIFGDDPRANETRQQLREITGVVDSRVPTKFEYFGDDENPALVSETDQYEVFQVRWPVFAQVFGEGLYVRQRKQASTCVIVVPDADQSPEMLLGLANHTYAPEADEEKAEIPIAQQFASAGCDVLLVSVVSRSPLPTDDQRRIKADFTDREWIYRQAFHMGRHVLGYDLQRVLSGLDALNARNDGATVGIAGYGEGGLIAMHAAAIDTRLDVALVSGYFDRSDSIWDEPIYRNVWSRLKAFGNAEVAALVAPRNLLIEYSHVPELRNQKGALHTPSAKDIAYEFGKLSQRPSFSLIKGEGESTVGPWSHKAIDSFLTALETTPANAVTETNERLVDHRKDAEQAIQLQRQRTRDQLETHAQALVDASDAMRNDAFLYQLMPDFRGGRWSTQREHPIHSPEPFIQGLEAFRQKFATEAMGAFDSALLPPTARTRKILETSLWSAYDVVIDIHSHQWPVAPGLSPTTAAKQTLFAWGVLLVPQDIKVGERRPVVVCQHGRAGVPRDTIDAANPAYNNFAAKLAEQGFVTFAPHNLYRGEEEYRWLDRKANAIGCSLFSFIIPQHRGIVSWLSSLPFVNQERLAFYGLSYGGETAVRVPPIVTGYALSICSGDFNQWTRKVASTREPFSFMNTNEWEMPYWNLGNTFDYAEMSYLMFPRPFMVERGHHDRVGEDRWVAYEFAKVRWLYAQFGLSDRAQIAYFQGGHSIHGDESFAFLRRHLQYPP